jgi:excisionase family DNA binding protein
MAMGFAIAQQLIQQQGGIAGAATPPPLPTQPAQPAAAQPPPIPVAAPELLAPGDVAHILNVSEGDVIATIQSGDLKAKKIGSTWRVTRAALDEFLKS